MHLRVYSPNQYLTREMHTRVERRFRFAFDHYAPFISWVGVRIMETEGPLETAVKKCQVQVMLNSGDDLLVEETNPSIYRTIDRAASKAETEVHIAIGRIAGVASRRSAPSLAEAEVHHVGENNKIASRTEKMTAQ